MRDNLLELLEGIKMYEKPSLEQIEAFADIYDLDNYEKKLIELKKKSLITYEYELTSKGVMAVQKYRNIQDKKKELNRLIEDER